MITAKYYSYLIRIWQSGDQIQGNWFASLEDPETNKTVYFKNMHELFEFLDTLPKRDKDLKKSNETGN